MIADQAGEGQVGEEVEVCEEADLAEVFDGRAGLARRYHEMLAGRGIEWGLLGPREAARLWSRHVLNSAAIEGLIPVGASVLDVGSGAGLPGIPVALARDDVRVTLLDSLLRRANFLQLAVEELGLGSRVDVVRARAEDTRRKYDVVVSRAVAPLARLLQWCEPLMRDRLIALKGDAAEQEVADAVRVLRALGLRAEVKSVESVGSWPSARVVVVTRL